MAECKEKSTARLDTLRAFLTRQAGIFCQKHRRKADCQQTLGRVDIQLLKRIFRRAGGVRRHDRPNEGHAQHQPESQIRPHRSRLSEPGRRVRQSPAHLPLRPQPPTCTPRRRKPARRRSETSCFWWAKAPAISATSATPKTPRRACRPSPKRRRRIYGNRRKRQPEDDRQLNAALRNVKKAV